MIAMAGLFVAVQSLNAQGGRRSDALLYPQTELPLYAGPEIGYGFWNNNADFWVADQTLPCAHFTDGDGSGLAIGAKAYWYFNDWFMLAPRARFEARSGSFITALADEPARNADQEIVMLQQEAQVDVTMATLTFDLMVGVDISSTGVYAVAGPSVSLLRDGFYDYTERLTGPANFVYSDTRTSEHTLVTERSFEQFESLAFDLRAGAGYFWQLGEFIINPEVFYSLPLTSALGEPGRLEQTGIVGSLGLLYNFGD